MQIKTRKQAAFDGDSKYWTGKTCSKNHESPRYTSTGICCKCNAEAAKAYNARMRKTVSARAQGHFVYLAHPDDHAALLAYAQALDLQRGRSPHVPNPPKQAEEMTPERIAEARRLAMGKAVDMQQSCDVDVSEAWMRDT